MKNSKVKGLLGLLVLLFAVGLFGFFGYDTMDDIKLGLDLAGGVSITYQAVDENPTSEEMSDTIYKLQPVSYTHLRAHETDSYLVCRLLLEKKKKQIHKHTQNV